MNHESIEISSIHETEENIQRTRDAFIKYQMEKAWEQTFAFVVQPGVEFSDTQIHTYDRKKTSELSHLIEKYDHLIFEAHSTDYQSGFHLRQMVRDHFAILKVGPALTFAMREALFALEYIERELINEKSNLLSNMIDTLDKVMVSNPAYWEKYYSSDPLIGSIQRKYSFLDRCRYYWTFPEIEMSVKRLIGNLSEVSIPFSLVSQFLPNQFIKVKESQIRNRPLDLILGKITDVLEEYLQACSPKHKQLQGEKY